MIEQDISNQISMLEEVFNQYAKEMCGKYRVKPDWFQIHIVPDAIHETEMKAGTTVHIYTRILPINPNANSYLKGWFRVIGKIHQPSSLTLVSDLYRWDNEKRKALKLQGFDPADSPLLPYNQLKITATVTVIVEDVVSGNIVAEEAPENKANVNVMVEKARVKLSRLNSIHHNEQDNA
jgi:hypothetical protein